MPTLTASQEPADVARGRMISKSLSTSAKWASLHASAGYLAEFCQILYTLLDDDSDPCPDCGQMAMCRYHSLLSALHGRTGPLAALQPAPDLAALAEKWKNEADASEGDPTEFWDLDLGYAAAKRECAAELRAALGQVKP